LTDLPEMLTPRSVDEIASYHAHVYYDPATTRSEAEQLRSWMGERFSVTLGRWHDVKVGPHDQAMFQVAFATEVFPALVPWLNAQSWNTERSGSSEHDESAAGSSCKPALDWDACCRAWGEVAGRRCRRAATGAEHCSHTSGVVAARSFRLGSARLQAMVLR
jgi:hypothetical protein